MCCQQCFNFFCLFCNVSCLFVCWSIVSKFQPNAVRSCRFSGSSWLLHLPMCNFAASPVHKDLDSHHLSPHLKESNILRFGPCTIDCLVRDIVNNFFCSSHHADEFQWDRGILVRLGCTAWFEVDHCVGEQSLWIGETSFLSPSSMSSPPSGSKFPAAFDDVRGLLRNFRVPLTHGNSYELLANTAWHSNLLT